jgi:hypothetical protein
LSPSQSFWILAAAAVSLHVLVTVTAVVARASAGRPRPSPSRSLSSLSFRQAQTQDADGGGDGAGSLATTLKLLAPLMSASHLLSGEGGEEDEEEDVTSVSVNGDSAGHAGVQMGNYSPPAPVSVPVPVPTDAPPPKQQGRAQSPSLLSKDRGESVGVCASCVLEVLCALRLLSIASVGK